MDIGVFGGTFSPPHVGHLRAAEFFAASRCLDRVFIFPAGASPLKETKAGIPDEDRLALCRLTFSGEIFEVSAWELERPGPSYTIETLRYVREMYPQAALFVLMGEDQRAQFHLWKDWQKILALAELVVVPRFGDISSTEIRAKLAARQDIAAFVAPEALRYIYGKGLYDARRLP